MLRALLLSATLLVLWLILSGHYGPLLIALGVASTIITTFIAAHMQLFAGAPALRLWRLPAYWLWLVAQIARANWDVAKRIISPRLPISPIMVRLQPSQRSDVGCVIYANSITLTPGTVTLGLEQDGLLVHALTAEAAAELSCGDMDRRVTSLEAAFTSGS